MNIFKPVEIIKKYQDFDIEKYKVYGYNAILIDIDNTLAIPDSQLKADLNAIKFVNKLKNNGFKVIIYSNNKLSRVKPFAESLDCKYVTWAFKPLPFKYLTTIKKFNLDRKKTLSLGDQILTDCIGSNLVGIEFIYTKQLVEKDSWKTVINRKIERLIFKYILHENV